LKGRKQELLMTLVKRSYILGRALSFHKHRLLSLAFQMATRISVERCTVNLAHTSGPPRKQTGDFEDTEMKPSELWTLCDDSEYGSIKHLLSEMGRFWLSNHANTFSIITSSEYLTYLFWQSQVCG
jgi:hypothetical protein